MKKYLDMVLGWFGLARASRFGVLTAEICGLELDVKFWRRRCEEEQLRAAGLDRELAKLRGAVVPMDKYQELHAVAMRKLSAAKTIQDMQKFRRDHVPGAAR